MSDTRKVTAEIFSILIVPPKKRDSAVGFDTRADEPPVTSVTHFEPSSPNLVAAEVTIKILH
jgi:hypothetical protein